MDKEEWVKAAISMVFAAKSDDTFDAWFVKYLITAIGEQVERTNEDRILQRSTTITSGTSRSSKRNPRLSKAQREAEALRQKEESEET
jgi:hypothetical protein